MDKQVAGDASGSFLFFVRNEILPKEANIPTLWTPYWLAQVYARIQICVCVYICIYMYAYYIQFAN